MRMRALVALPDRNVEQGQEFDVARPIEALALSYQRKAQILEGMRLHLETATVEAEPSQPDQEPIQEAPRRKRRYRRRDLTAEP